MLSKRKGLFYLYINMLIVICDLLMIKISLIKTRSYDRGCLSIFKPNKVVLKSKCHPIALQVKNIAKTDSLIHNRDCEVRIIYSFYRIIREPL